MVAPAVYTGQEIASPIGLEAGDNNYKVTTRSLTLFYGEDGEQFPITAEDTVSLFSMPDGTPASHVRLDPELCTSEGCTVGIKLILGRIEDGLRAVDIDEKAPAASFLSSATLKQVRPTPRFFLGEWDLRKSTARAAVASGLDGGRVKACLQIHAQIEEVKSHAR